MSTKPTKAEAARLRADLRAEHAHERRGTAWAPMYDPKCRRCLAEDKLEETLGQMTE